MDERISQGRAGVDIAPIGLNVKSDGIELDHEEIYFAELASWLEAESVVLARVVLIQNGQATDEHFIARTPPPNYQ
jgi:hypothetical protein